MLIETDDENLLLLYREGRAECKAYKRLPKGVVEGNLRDYESVRCNGRWRLLFKSQVGGGGTIITNVKLIKLSDHYDDL